MGFDHDEVARFRIAIARITKGVDRVVVVDGMTRAQLSVLSTVARLGPLTASELSTHEGLNPTMVSRILGVLEDRELLVRSPDPGDRRIVHAAVTPAGRALHQKLRRRRTALFDAHLADIGAEHAAELQAALPALEALGAAMTPPSTPAPTPKTRPEPATR